MFWFTTLNEPCQRTKLVWCVYKWVSLFAFLIKQIMFMFKVMQSVFVLFCFLTCCFVSAFLKPLSSVIQVQPSCPTHAAVYLLECDPGNATACQVFDLTPPSALYSMQPRILLRLPSEQTVSSSYWGVHYAPKIHTDSNKSFPITAESHCCPISFCRRI